MTADEDPDTDPQDGAASLVGEPEMREESASDRRLAELFAPLTPSAEPRYDVEDAAGDGAAEQRLAALFAGLSTESPPVREGIPDFSWDPRSVSPPEPASGSSRQPVMETGTPTGEEQSTPDAAPSAKVVDGSPGPERVPQPEPEGEPQPQQQSPVLPEAGPVPQPESEPESAAELEPEPAAQLAAEPHAELEPEPRAEIEPEPEPRAEIEPEPEPQDPVLPVAGPALGASALAPTAPADATAAGDTAGDAPAEGPGSEAPAADAEIDDSLAWLEHLVEEPAVTPQKEAGFTTEKASAGSWLETIASGGAVLPASPVPAAVATPAAVGASSHAQPSQGQPTDVPPQTVAASVPPRRRGIRAWSTRVRWSVAVSILLLIGVVAGGFAFARSVAADNLAAQQLAAAVDDLEAAEAYATEPQSVLDAAVAEYEATVETARATADSAAPPLAAIAGMAPQEALDASNAALAALNAKLAEPALGDLPEPYERGDVDMSDIDEVAAATQSAQDHEDLVAAATRDVRGAQASLQQALDALRAAQVALGASLPDAAAVIVGENRRALQSFRDAVTEASVAVPAAQNAGGSGDAEMLAYAAAVTALRADQARAATGVKPVTPTTRSSPAPVRPATPVPVPVPEPAPAPVPEPDPVPTPDVPPVPTP